MGKLPVCLDTGRGMLRKLLRPLVNHLFPPEGKRGEKCLLLKEKSQKGEAGETAFPSF